MATKTDFDLNANQKAERKLLVTAVKVGEDIVPVGVGVEDSTIDYGIETTTTTDIFGITETSVDKMQPTQELSPMTVRGGNKLLFKLVDIAERNALSEFSEFEVYVIRAYLNDGTDNDPAYRCEKHVGCTIVPLSEGGSGYVDMPIKISLSNNKTLGTVSAYKYGETINFTGNTPS